MPDIVSYVSIIMINTDHKQLAKAAFSLMVMDIGIKFSVSFNQNDMLREKLSGGKFRDLCYSKDYRWEQAHSLQREQPRQKNTATTTFQR